MVLRNCGALAQKRRRQARYVPGLLGPERVQLTRQKDVDAFPHAEGHGDNPVGTWLAVEAANEVGEVVQNGKVVLHHNDILGGL